MHQSDKTTAEEILKKPLPHTALEITRNDSEKPLTNKQFIAQMRSRANEDFQAEMHFARLVKNQQNNTQFQTDSPLSDQNVDTIPSKLKEHFFKGKKKPDLLADYDCIGFDADECIVKYKMNELTRHLCKTFLLDLYEHFEGYSKDILFYDYQQDLSVFNTNAVFDINRGTLLKLAEGKVITHAMWGLDILSQETIEKMYGQPPIFKPLNFPTLITQMQPKEEAFWTLMGNFDSCKIPVICKVVQCIRNFTVKKSYYDFAFDLIQVHFRQTSQFNNLRIIPLSQNKFLRTINKERTRFIVPQPRLRNQLQRLKDAGKFLFITSDYSHVEYMDVIMSATLGHDWRNFFDFIAANCFKPLFQRAENPFFEVDQEALNLKGTKISDVEGLEKAIVKNKTLLEGNAILLTKYLQKKLGKTTRIVHFSSNFFTDIGATYELNPKLKSMNLPEWSSIAVIEELCLENTENPDIWRDIKKTIVRSSPQIWGPSSFLHQRLGQSQGRPQGVSEWGKSHFRDDLNYTGHRRAEAVVKAKPIKVMKNYFVSKVSEMARYAIPVASNIEQLMPLQINPSSGSVEFSNQRYDAIQKLVKQQMETGNMDKLKNLLDPEKRKKVAEKQQQEKQKEETNQKYSVEDMLSGIALQPRAKHTKTLIWLHGCGDSGRGYKGVFMDSKIDLPEGCRVVLPTAPRRAVAIKGGRIMPSWYDIREKCSEDDNLTDYFFERRCSQAEIRTSIKQISGIIKEETELLNGDSSQIFLGGFAQGGSIALATYLVFNNGPLGGVAVCSGSHKAIIDWTKVDIQQRKQTPLAFFHGSADKTIPHKHAQKSYELLRAKGLDHFELFLEPNCGHELTSGTFEGLVRFFSQYMTQSQNTVTANSIKKSLCDKRSYRYLHLPNRMRVMLVQDYESKSAAACLQVGVGNLQDPTDFDGLAHFCEHMLFLGTQEFPQENHYAKFIQDNGGSKNAGTSEDYTQFYFDVRNEAFSEALEIFSTFFKCPLFTKSAADREMKAVDAEFKKNLSSDSRRIYQLFRSSIVRKGCPLNTFGTGNLGTLLVPKTYEKLLQFYKQNYSANIMSLCLVGNHPLDELQKMAEQYFSPVVDKALAYPDYSKEIVYDDSRALGHLYKVVPINNVKRLVFRWPGIPDQSPVWRSQPAAYVATVLGHEGKNSLLSELVKQDLATDLAASLNSQLKEQLWILCLEITLTEKGLKHVQSVTRLVWAHINQLKKLEPPEYLHSERKVMGEISFDYDVRASALSSAQSIAHELRVWRGAPPNEAQYECKVEELLQKPCITGEFKPELIKEVYEKLTPEQCVILIISQSHLEKYEQEDFDTEFFYGTKYVKAKLSEATLESMRSAKVEKNENLGYPERNPFVPDTRPVAKRLPKAESPSKPVLIESNSSSKIWFKQDDQFDQPFVCARVKFMTTDCDFQSARGHIFFLFWARTLTEFLREDMYQAELANSSWNAIDSTAGYFTLSFFSYNTKYGQLIEKIMKEMKTFETKEKFFNSTKEQIKRQFNNILNCEPYEMVESLTSVFLETNQYEVQEYLDAVAKMSFTDFMDMKEQWLTQLNAEWLVTGHLTEAEAKSTVEMAEKALNFTHIGREEVSLSRCVKLQPKVYNFERQNMLKDNPNSCCLISFPGTLENNREASAVLRMLTELLSERFFTQLRTQEQLGYVVQAYLSDHQRVEHLNFKVQSSVKDPDFLEHRINEFFLKAKSESWLSSEDQLTSVKNAAINSLTQKNTNIATESGHNWEQIVRNELNFDVREKLIAAIQNVTLSKVNQLFNSLIFGKTRLVMRIYSHKHWESDRSQSISLNGKFYSEHLGSSSNYKVTDKRVFQMHHGTWARH